MLSRRSLLKSLPRCEKKAPGFIHGDEFDPPLENLIFTKNKGIWLIVVELV
jgi:hypothetical protein